MIYITFFILFYGLNFFFIKFWRKKKKNTPQGAGILLLINFSYLSLTFYYPLIFFLMLFSLSIIYFFDDLISINFKWRVLIQIITPIILFYLTANILTLWTLTFSMIFYFILINTLNFQDGEDLNIGFFLIIIFTIFYFFSSYLVVQKISILNIIFLIVFLIFNAKKNNLYFGDSGCYLASIFIFIFLIIDLENKNLIKAFLCVSIFPVIDVFYVAIYRLVKGENLLSRNYYHIYQVLSKKIKFKLYVLPNLIFAIVNFILLGSLKLDLIFIMILTMLNIIFCTISHLIIKKFQNLK